MHDHLGRSTKVAGVLALAGLAVAYVELVPNQLRLKCPIHSTTGIYCPGCGGQRWLASLLHGDFVAAWNYNQLLSLSPLLAIAYYLIAKAKPGKRTHIVLISILSALIVAFVVWRNLPTQAAFLNQ